MGNDMLISVLLLFAKLYVSILLLRVMLQVAKADYYNPISQTVVRLTQPLLTPLQKLLPKAGRLDLSPVMLGFFVLLITLLLITKGQGNFPTLITVSLVNLVYQLLDLYFYAVIGSVIISWVAPGSYHPAPQLIQQVTEPLFSLTQKVIPPLGGLDLSPILIILLIQLIQAQLSPFVL